MTRMATFTKSAVLHGMAMLQPLLFTHHFRDWALLPLPVLSC